MATNFKIDGLDELIKATDGLADNITLKMMPVLETEANRIMAQAKLNIYAGKHIKRGDLIKGLKINKPRPNYQYKYRVFASVWFDESARHGVPVELGHKFSGFLKGYPGSVPEKKFLRPAADKLKKTVYTNLKNELNNALESWIINNAWGDGKGW